MNKRQEKLMLRLVRSHIDTGAPVSSAKLCRDYDIAVSPATVRSDLYALEEAGYLQQPHTSAGRVPTARGYRFYVKRLHKHLQLQAQEKKRLQAAATQQKRYKEMAKALAEMTGETVIVVREGDSVYFTGMKNLFSKPEFAQIPQIAALSELFDDIENNLEQFVPQLSGGTQVQIGKETGFGQACSTISVKAGPDTTFVLLGPMRMQYQRNISLLNSLHRLL